MVPRIMVGPGIGRMRSLSAGRKVVIVALVLGLAFGLLIAPLAFEATVETSPDRIAVVPIVGVMDGSNTQDVTRRLTRARQDPSIDAVVLFVDSPGGLAVAGEEIFMQVERTAQEKPVVATVGLRAASAGYKAMLPAEEIYVKPASSVGSVGTILLRPEPVDPVDRLIESGPQKFDGDTPRGYEYNVQMIGQSFSRTVMEYRGDRLELTRAELEHARIYNGIEGVELGLVDGISDTQGAIQAAAELAELDSYDVTVMEYETEVRFLDRAAYTASTQPNKSMVTIDELVDPDGGEVVPTALMLPSAAISDLVVAEANATPVNASTEDPGGDSDAE